MKNDEIIDRSKLLFRMFSILIGSNRRIKPNQCWTLLIFDIFVFCERLLSFIRSIAESDRRWFVAHAILSCFHCSRFALKFALVCAFYAVSFSGWIHIAQEFVSGDTLIIVFIGFIQYERGWGWGYGNWFYSLLRVRWSVKYSFHQ